MAMSFDVRLSKELLPRWPQRCVACDRADPGHATRLVDRSTNLWSTLTLQFAPKVTVSAPACPDCARGFERRRLLERVTTWVTVLAGVWLGLTLVAPRFPSFPGMVVAGACGLLAYAPAVLVRIFWAPTFSISAWDDMIDYEFSSEEYAREFAALNEVELG